MNNDDNKTISSKALFDMANLKYLKKFCSCVDCRCESCHTCNDRCKGEKNAYETNIRCFIMSTPDSYKLDICKEYNIVYYCDYHAKMDENFCIDETSLKLRQDITLGEFYESITINDFNRIKNGNSIKYFTVLPCDLKII